MANPDRHSPENSTFTLRPPQDIRDYIAEQLDKRDISRSALIYEALREKRARETAGT